MFFKTDAEPTSLIHTIDTSVHPLHTLDLRRELSCHPVLFLTHCSFAIPSSASFVTTQPDIETSYPARTECGNVSKPSRFLTFSNTSSHPVTVAFASFATIFTRLSAFDVSLLRTECVSLADDVNVPMSSSTTRMRLTTSDAPQMLSKKLHQLYSNVVEHANDECLLNRNRVSMPPNSFIIFDNERLAHSVCEGDKIHLKCMSFSFTNSPDLDAALYSSSKHPLFSDNIRLNGKTHNQTVGMNENSNGNYMYQESDGSSRASSSILNLSNWSAISHAELLNRVSQNFKSLYHSTPGLYWGKVLHCDSGAENGFGMCSALPADLKEVVQQRERARAMYIDVGLIRHDDLYANLFETSKCSRSLELRTHMLSSIDVASFPLGTQMDDSELYGMVMHYGMSVIAGPLSKLLQFAVFCMRDKHTFPRLRAALYSNDMHGLEDIRPLKQLKDGADDKQNQFSCFGTLESNFAGPYAITKANDSTVYHAIPDVSLLHVVDENGIDVEMGEVGEIAVTLLNRRKIPAIKVREGIMGRRVTTTEDKVEFIGTRLDSQNNVRKFKVSGSATEKQVSWKDVVDSLGKFLQMTFKGAVLFQVMLYQRQRRISVPVWTVKMEEVERVRVEKEVKSLIVKLFADCGFEHYDVQWLESGHDLKRYPSYALMSFVDV